MFELCSNKIASHAFFETQCISTSGLGGHVVTSDCQSSSKSLYITARMVDSTWFAAGKQHIGYIVFLLKHLEVLAPGAKNVHKNTDAI